MPKLTSTLVFLVNAGLVSSGRMSRKTRNESSQPGEDCKQLSELAFNGIDFGPVSMLVCQFWPGGNFPAKDVNKLSGVLESAMAPGGAWDQIQSIRDERGSDRGFCWRQDKMRTKSEGECEMTSGGVCYGDCPYGYKPKLLLGKFAPVCNSACSDSNLPVACGFGCARGVYSCAGALLQQVGSIATSVTKVYEAVGGNTTDTSGMVWQASRIVSLSEIILSVGGRVWKNLISISESVDRDDFSLEAIILLLQAVKEATPGLNEDFEILERAMKDIVAMLVGMMTSFSSDGIDLVSIKNAFLDQSDEILDAALNVLKTFTYAKCEAANDVAFTLDNMGDDRLMGPWVQRGIMHGKPKYTIKGERGSIMEWSESRAQWEIFVDRWCGVTCLGGREIMYVNAAHTYDFPTEGWVVETGAAPAPEVIAMREPLQQ